MILNHEEIQIKNSVVLTWNWTMGRYRSKIMCFIHDTEPWGDTDQRSCSSYMAMNHEEIQIKDRVSCYMTLNHEEIQIKERVVLTCHWTIGRYRSKIMYFIHDTEPWGNTDQRSCSSYMTWRCTMRRYRSTIM